MNLPHETHPTIANLQARIRELEGKEQHTVFQEENKKALSVLSRHKGAKPWFSNSTEAIRWIRDEARQFYTDNPQVAAHLFETATIFERELYAANARIAELEKMVK